MFVEKRTTPLCDVGKMHRGSQPTDNGNLILTEEDAEYLKTAYPALSKYIKPYMMGKDFIQRKPRYCLWLVNITPSELRQSREILERVEKVREFRLSSSKASTRKKADTPTLFDENQQPDTDYIALPKVSSERRRYIPLDFMTAETIMGDKCYIVENASLFHFGVMTSNVHMAWMRTVCGRLKSDYSYSNTIVSNNFPWPTPTDEQKAKIEATAQGILNARTNYPDASLADLYDELTMPIELRKAHQANDRVVMDAYGFSIKMTEQECIAELMKMYQKLVSEQ